MFLVNKNGHLMLTSVLLVYLCTKKCTRLALRTYLSYQITTATLNDRKVANKFFKGILYLRENNEKPS